MAVRRQGFGAFSTIDWTDPSREEITALFASDEDRFILNKERGVLQMLDCDSNQVVAQAPVAPGLMKELEAAVVAVGMRVLVQ